MEDVHSHTRPGSIVERRREKRSYALSEPMVELKFPNFPTYQLKLKEISHSGAGIVVRPDSKVLGLVAIGQELKLRLLSPVRSEILSGDYAATVEHVSEIKEGPYKGHYVVGVSLRRITEKEKR